MDTPSTIRTPFVPPRREEIAALATEAHAKYIGKSIDEVAEEQGFLLIRLADANTTKEGFCCALPTTRRKRVARIARPGIHIISFTEEEPIYIMAIIITPATAANENEVFWHEYYHLYYSPSRQGGATFFGGYSSGGVLDKQEENRANLFAACILVPEIAADDTMYSLAEKYDVSFEIAKARLQLR